MQRKKLGTAIVWMVCLLGMVAVVWSRPPIGGSGTKSHPPLALTDPQAEPAPAEPLLADPVPQELTGNIPAPIASPVASEPCTLPAGKWVREVYPYKMTIDLKGHELRVTIVLNLKEDEDANFECQLSGEYHVTRDSMFYGVISSGELRMATKDAEERLEADAFITTCLYDQPFAFRYRLDREALTIKDFKIGSFPSEFDELAEVVKLIPGRFYVAGTEETDSPKEKPAFR